MLQLHRSCPFDSQVPLIPPSLPPPCKYIHSSTDGALCVISQGCGCESNRIESLQSQPARRSQFSPMLCRRQNDPIMITIRFLPMEQNIALSNQDTPESALRVPSCVTFPIIAKLSRTPLKGSVSKEIPRRFVVCGSIRLGGHPWLIGMVPQSAAFLPSLPPFLPGQSSRVAP
jgi:hypothetical protein